MEILYAFFAEAVQATSDGRINILGANLHTLHVQGPSPWTAPAFALLVSLHFNRDNCGHLYHFTADLLRPDDTQIDPHVESDFVVPVPENPDYVVQMNLLLQLGGMQLPVPGAYHMRIRVEDRERDISQEKRVRLRVTDAVQQNHPS